MPAAVSSATTAFGVLRVEVLVLPVWSSRTRRIPVRSSGAQPAPRGDVRCRVCGLVEGYGGFGYDTSHVKKDDKVPAVVTAAQKGDLAKVRQLVKADIRVLSATQRWTEVDFKGSGFTKEWQWLTA